MGLPHLSQTSSVGSSWALMSFMSFFAFSRSTLNFFQNWLRVFRKLSRPSSISSSSSSMAAVYSTLMMSWKCSTSMVDHHEAELGGVELALALLRVLAGLDGGDDGGVGGGPADAVLLQLLHEGASLKRGGGCVKCWSVSSFLRARESPSARGRQLGGGVVDRLVLRSRRVRLRDGLRRDLLLALLLVDGEEALELQRGALGPELVGRPAPRRRGGDVHHRLVVDRGTHLRGHEAVPDERVEP